MKDTIDTEGIFKLPPQSQTMEKLVLGALMLDADAITEIADFLKPNMLYKPAHEKIYSAILHLYNQSEPIDCATVMDTLKKKGTLTEEGAGVYLVELTNLIASSANIVYHARIIQQNWIKRSLITIASKIQMEAYDDTSDCIEVLGLASTEIDRLNGSIESGERSYSDIVYKTVDNLKEATKHDYKTGTQIYLSAFDRHTLGYQDSDLVIIAARPGMGKTAFIVQSAKRQAENALPVGIISLEMSAEQLVQRVFSNDLRIDITSLKKGGLKKHQWETLDSRTKSIADMPVLICDNGGLTINQIVAIAKKWKLKYGIKILYIDYIQLISSDSYSKNGNREQEISAISRRLKQLAKELNIPVIALSQLSRAVEQRGDKRPMLSDLRESGAIEQDADMVIFLYRDEYYGIENDKDGGSTQNVCEIIIAKYRNGEPAIIKTEFYPENFYFSDKGTNNIMQSEPQGKLVPMKEAIDKDSNYIPF